jgi:cobaltochelatase CobT
VASHWREADAELPFSSDHGQSHRRLAHRLQRRLQAARLRRWSFEQHDGLLDSRRLARLLIPAADPAVFRRESEIPMPEACVVLLVDQSSSMRGAPRQIALLAVDLAVRALELFQVRCELLGYTTRFGADNPLTRDWATAGKPQAPGRLNAVRHIIYKTADQRWRRARRHVGLMLAAGFGRENIDGEALIWAASRLRMRPEPNKVLVVLSDGVPYDAATVAANGRLFLHDHLRAAIARIESGPIQLAAIGAGQHVGRYYRNALTLRDAREVAPVLLAHLGDVLTRVKDLGRSRRRPR